MIANSASSSAPGFCRIEFGTDSLPMSWSRPPIASARSRAPVKPELLADRNRECGDAAGVLLGRAVLLREPDHQGPHASTEERLLGGNHLGGAQIAGERT